MEKAIYERGYHDARHRAARIIAEQGALDPMDDALPYRTIAALLRPEPPKLSLWDALWARAYTRGWTDATNVAVLVIVEEELSEMSKIKHSITLAISPFMHQPESVEQPQKVHPA